MVRKTIVECPQDYGQNPKRPEVVIGGQDCPHWIPKEAPEEVDEPQAIEDKE